MLRQSVETHTVRVTNSSAARADTSGFLAADLFADVAPKPL